MVTKKSGLIIIVVLALTSLVEGGFQIGTRYVDGRPFEPDTDILQLDESLYLSIWTDELVFGTELWGYYWALVCDWSLATITGGEAGPDAPPLVYFYGSASELWDALVPPGAVTIPEDEDGQWGQIWDLELWPGLYLDNFLYTPISAGDVTVRFLKISGDFVGEVLSVPDSIVIHQVPEPMTIVLFSLGGLFLLRRK